MKYIIFEKKIGMSERHIPIIFPDILVHEEVYIAIRGLINGNIISAGTYSSISGECSRTSTTLEVGSREVDSDIIKMYDYFHGVKL